MPITPAEAADVAKRHGLSLQDAAGLLSLADDLADAEAIASRFAGPDVAEATRQWTRALFGRGDATPSEPPDNPPAPDDDTAERRYVADLFNQAP